MKDEATSEDQPQQPMGMEQYVDLVIETTSRMIGILSLEMQTGMERMSQYDVVHYQIATMVLADLQIMARQKRESSHPDLLIAEKDTRIVDKNGIPYN